LTGTYLGKPITPAGQLRQSVRLSEIAAGVGVVCLLLRS
jgi:hypothetical protein